MEVLAFCLADVELRARYDRLFEACPGAFIQQSTYWAEVIQTLGPDVPIFLLYNRNGEDLAGLPLYLYKHPLGNVLTSVPQAGPLGGVFCRDGLSPEQTGEAYGGLLRRALELAREHACLTLTLITNPFLHDLELYARWLEPTFLFENFSQYIALDQVISGGRITLPDYNRRSNLCRNLRKAREAGFTVTHETSDADLEAWYLVHARRHTEIGAKPLNIELFRNILRVLHPRQKAHLLLVRHGSDIASGCIYIYHRSVLDVFLLSMETRYQEMAPNFLNTEQSLLWADARGIRKYNWQSSPSRASGVYRYKKQWGSVETPYYFVTRLLCPLKCIQELGLDGIKANYPWHYVVPFGALEAGTDQAHFRKP